MVPTSRPQNCLNMRDLEMIFSTRKQFGKERELIEKSLAKAKFESIGKTLEFDTVLDITECNWFRWFLENVWLKEHEKNIYLESDNKRCIFRPTTDQNQINVGTTRRNIIKLKCVGQSCELTCRQHDQFPKSEVPWPLRGRSGKFWTETLSRLEYVAYRYTRVKR